MTRGVGSAAGRWISVEPERLGGWLERFEARHGTAALASVGDSLCLSASDGTTAECRVPFPPLPDGTASYAGLVEHVLVERRVGVLLVRLGGHAAGVFEGRRLIASKVGSRHVHGRSAAGGWSQQRFARRRDNQVREALGAAADLAFVVLVPLATELDAVVLGGDRRSVLPVLEDPRLTVLRPLLAQPVLDVPDPRLRVLERTPQMFRAIRIRISEPSVKD